MRVDVGLPGVFFLGVFVRLVVVFDGWMVVLVGMGLRGPLLRERSRGLGTADGGPGQLRAEPELAAGQDAVTWLRCHR